MSNFGLGGRKAPPPDQGNFSHQIYPFQAILSNFGFCGRKAHPPPAQMRENFLTPDLSISGNFEQLGFWWQKTSPPQMRENFLTPDLSISGNFKQLWFWWQKSPPPPSDEGKIFDTRSINFRQFQATLVLVAEKTPPMWEKFWTPDLSISGNFKQLWFWWQKSPPNEGKFFDTRSIHFRQFLATLVFVPEKPPPPTPGKFLTLDLSISGNFEQLWFLWQKSPPPT